MFFVVDNVVYWNEKAFMKLLTNKPMEIKEVKGFIVKKLFHHGYIGGRHTDIENLKKGLPGHFKGDVKAATKELMKEGIIMPKQTSYGLHVSLNPRKRTEIDEYLK